MVRPWPRLATAEAKRRAPYALRKMKACLWLTVCLSLPLCGELPLLRSCCTIEWCAPVTSSCSTHLMQTSRQGEWRREAVASWQAHAAPLNKLHTFVFAESVGPALARHSLRRLERVSAKPALELHKLTQTVTNTRIHSAVRLRTDAGSRMGGCSSPQPRKASDHLCPLFANLQRQYGHGSLARLGTRLSTESPSSPACATPNSIHWPNPVNRFV